MKKKLVAISFLVAISSIAFAGGFHFDAVPEGTLYPEYFADPYAAESSLGIIYETDVSLNTTRLLEDSEYYGQEYKILDSYINNHWDGEDLFINAKFGMSNGLFRFGYDGIFETEFQFKGLFNTVFDTFSHSDQETFDGIANFAINLRLFDKVTLHGGLFHYSGHVADEAIQNMKDEESIHGININDFLDDPYRYHFLDYCNDNLYTVALSVNPIKEVRVFSELQWMPQTCSVGPMYLWRNDRITSWGTTDQTNPDYPDYYKGFISISGIDLSYAFCKTVAVYTGGIVKLHQNGQITSDRTYHEDYPWEIEWGATAGLKLLQKDGTGSTQVFITYFDGRFPGTSYFNIRMKYYKVGVSFSM